MDICMMALFIKVYTFGVYECLRITTIPASIHTPARILLVFIVVLTLCSWALTILVLICSMIGMNG